MHVSYSSYKPNLMTDCRAGLLGVRVPKITLLVYVFSKSSLYTGLD